MDNFRFVKCQICGWEKNPRMSCFNCGDKAPATSKTSSDTALAAAEARIAELEEAFTWSMHNWGDADAAHSFSLFVLGRGGDGDLGDCFAYWKSTRRAAALLKEKE